MLNQDETAIDCGGAVCPPYECRQSCVTNSDCASLTCDVVTDTCVASTCINNVIDPGETVVDCGSAQCPPCATGEACLLPRDCQSGVCSTGSCAAPTCSDGVLNQDETDIDCGGNICPNCSGGKICEVNSDCGGDLCTNGTCVNLCSDGIQNGDESGIDCGGSCLGCAIGGPCDDDLDCASGSCNEGTNLCVNACTDGQPCVGNTDCQNNLCQQNLCGRTLQQQHFRLYGARCRLRGACVPCGVGQNCNISTDCSAGNGCVGGLCLCIPLTCAEAGAECGSVLDGCGGTQFCPSCT